jgi:hypothetical protein
VEVAGELTDFVNQASALWALLAEHTPVCRPAGHAASWEILGMTPTLCVPALISWTQDLRKLYPERARAMRITLIEAKEVR